jgi:hypothetical protein
MPLTEIWNATPKTILGMLLPAVVNIATNGEGLKDGSTGAAEFRQYLTEVEAEKLAEYATYCIENSFPDSGQVLQDIVNEMGRRLGFHAENGRYRGVRNEIGYDGIWTANGQSLVIEVKTTDAYTIKLDTVVTYRDRLVEEQRIPKDTPILIVIGRNDTSSLEAQVRGSRHAWSIRIAGIDALIKLMEVNLSTSSEQVTEKIHTILRPFEYTRIDQIVDVVFTTAEDKEITNIEIKPNLETTLAGVRTIDRTPNEFVYKIKAQAISRLSEREQCNIHKKRHSLYADASDTIHAAVIVSKAYDDGAYWYAYHQDPQRKFLSQGIKGFLVLCMTDRDYALAIPYDFLEKYWESLNETIKNERIYKHIRTWDLNGKIVLRVNQVGTEVELDQFRI